MTVYFILSNSACCFFRLGGKLSTLEIWTKFPFHEYFLSLIDRLLLTSKYFRNLPAVVGANFTRIALSSRGPNVISRVICDSSPLSGTNSNTWSALWIRSATVTGITVSFWMRMGSSCCRPTAVFWKYKHCCPRRSFWIGGSMRKFGKMASARISKLRPLVRDGNEGSRSMTSSKLLWYFTARVGANTTTMWMHWCGSMTKDESPAMLKPSMDVLSVVLPTGTTADFRATTIGHWMLVGLVNLKRMRRFVPTNVCWTKNCRRFGA